MTSTNQALADFEAQLRAAFQHMRANGAQDLDTLIGTALAVLDDQARERYAQQVADETHLMAIDFRNGMSMELKPAQDMVAIWCGAARGFLGDAPNYVETPVEMDVKVAESPEQFTFTLQRKDFGRLTPHEARQEAEARVAELEAELEQLRAERAAR
ncbi:hypothetical protein ACIQGZ_17165 [Streptomyces sp. NPDC092296]|uniref:hypothetical protein n=1 Tax=Streptomyces sp. NPDC092296 TaxID=3366012 RepID=UPI0038237A2E